VESCPIKRAVFHKRIEALPKERLYYIDECGIDSFIYREHAYAPRGVKVIGSISGKKFKRTNIVAAKCGNDVVAPMIYDGTTDSILFEYWFEHCFLPVIPKDSYCVVDNASFHRKGKLRTLAEAANCHIEFLPPYSPDLNLIEPYWFWIKQRLRKTLHNYDNFMDALIDCF
jgi:transposase